MVRFDQSIYREENNYSFYFYFYWSSNEISTSTNGSIFQPITSLCRKFHRTKISCFHFFVLLVGIEIRLNLTLSPVTSISLKYPFFVVMSWFIHPSSRLARDDKYGEYVMRLRKQHLLIFTWMSLLFNSGCEKVFFLLFSRTISFRWLIKIIVF